MTTPLTPVALEALNRADLARLYNTLAERPVKAFSTLTLARDRVQALLTATSRAIFHDGAQLVTGVVEAEPVVPAPPLVEIPADFATVADAADEVIDPANLPELTTLEHKMLTALVSSDFNQGGNPVGQEVWTTSVYDYCDIKERSRGGVVSSLVAKGFVQLRSYDRPDDMLILTRRGAVALTASDEPLDIAPAKVAPALAPAASAPRAEPAPRPAKAPGTPRVAGGRTLLSPRRPARPAAVVRRRVRGARAGARQPQARGRRYLRHVRHLPRRHDRRRVRGGGRAAAGVELGREERVGLGEPTGGVSPHPTI